MWTQGNEEPRFFKLQKIADFKILQEKIMYKERLDFSLRNFYKSKPTIMLLLFQ